MSVYFCQSCYKGKSKLLFRGCYLETPDSHSPPRFCVLTNKPPKDLKVRWTDVSSEVQDKYNPQRQKVEPAKPKPEDSPDFLDIVG